MSNRQIFRYEVPIDDQPHELTLTGDPVAAATQRHAYVIEFWAEHSDTWGKTDRTFQVFGTGHPLPEDARWVASCPRDGQGFVWHLYELENAESRTRRGEIK